MKKLNKLTTKEYWDDQYCDIDSNYNFVNDWNTSLSFRELDKYFKRKIRPNAQWKFIEIGCAPGGFMQYFYKNFKYNVEGLDYAERGVEMTKKNLEKVNIPTIVYQADLFNNSIKKEEYDVVFSAGFIEHFDNPTLAIKKHLELLKKGGYLIIEIPNLRGFNYFFQKLASKSVLEMHNTEIMNVTFFEELSEEFDVERIDINYVGKINFGIFVGRKSVLYFGYAIQKLLNLIYNKFEFIPIKDNKYTSPYIVGVFKK